ncbi:MAG TPA: AMP-binding protein, partial [Thermoanaerobaculia bacterium]|nr:AMP-binding protein [Thermoanaerobaculia bacterium]
FFGSLYGGATAVPAYPPRLGRNQSRLQAIVRDARPSVVLTTAEIAAKSASLIEQVPELASAVFLATDNLPAGVEQDWRMPPLAPADLAFLQYTSGSTATPKGVMVSHGNLMHNQEMIRLAFGQSEESVVVGWLPLYHDMGLIGNILQPLYVGGSCVLMSPIAFLQRPMRWLAAITRYQGTTSGGPNFAYDLCVRKARPEDLAQLDLRSWRVAFNGAEPVRARTLDAFAEAFAASGFDRRAFYPCYGLAEATLFVSGGARDRPPHILPVQPSSIEDGRAIPSEEKPEPLGEARKLVGCGHAWLEQKILVVDPETTLPRAPREVGEIWVSGPSVAGGYWGNSEVTEKTFRATQPDHEGFFLRTGDLGFLAEGELFVIGRLKDLIIIRGRNLYPEDVEQAVEAASPSLRRGSTAAFSVDVDGEERLIVACELERGAGAASAEAATLIRQAISAEYGAQVYEVLFLSPSTIPKTSSGKIQRHACRQRYQAAQGLSIVARNRIGADGSIETLDREPAPTPAPGSSASAALIEEMLPLLAGLLRRPVAALDPQVPLLSYGLDSLSAVEVQHAIASRLEVAIDLGELLGGASLAELAQGVLAKLAERNESRRKVVEGAEERRPPSAPAGSAEPAEDRAGFPLSYGQEALWFLQRLDPAGAAYNIVAAVRVLAELDLPALREAFGRLVDRHEILKVSFAESETGPLQRVEPGRRFELSFEDASSWSAGQLAARLEEAAYRPFDLLTEPLLRVAIFGRSSGENLILLSVHHIVADLWSLGILVRELGALYREITAGSEDRLPRLPLRFADYVSWQRKRLAGPKGEELWRFWQSQLAGNLQPADLPTDRPRPPYQTFRGGARALSLPGELIEQAKRLGLARRSTLYATLLAAFAGLLHRYSGQEDLLIGSPTSGRDAAEFAGLMGYFVNPVVLRCDLGGTPSFARLLERVRDTTFAAFKHQEYPFPLLVERLQPQRDPSRSPIFQVMLSFQRSPLPQGGDLGAFALGEPGARIELAGWTVESLGLEHRVAQFDLELLAAETAAGLSLVLLFNADLYDGPTAARALSHLGALLRHALVHPERPLAELPILEESEHRELLAAGTGAAYPFSGTVIDHFLDQVRRAPGSPAVRDTDGELSYAELEARSARAARGLLAAGLSAEQPVVLWAERSADFLVAMLAIFRAGGAYLPVDPRQPARRLVQMLEQSGAPVVLTRRGLFADCRSAAERLPETARPQILAIEDLLTGSAEGVLPPPSPAAMAYVLYTSGSTGVPKGAMLEHRGMLNHIWGKIRDLDLGPSDRIAQNAAATFDISVWQFLAALVVGGRVLVISDEVAGAPAQLLAEVEQHGVTILETVPALLRAMLH